MASVLIVQDHENSEDTYVAVYVIFLSAMGTGLSIANAPSIVKAKMAARKIFEIIDEPSIIDTRQKGGLKTIEEGRIEFSKVDFLYPSRKEKVLKSLDMVIPANKKIAIVGSSGCGKSTIASLILRLNDVKSGSLKIDGIDIRDYNVS